MRTIDQIMLVTSKKQVVSNMKRFEIALESEPEFQRRIPYVHAWYALQKKDGQYLFAMSKFVGFEELTVQEYLKFYKKGLDGRDTEWALSDFFEEVDPESSKFHTLHSELKNFLAPYNKMPRSKVRIYLVDEARDRSNQEILAPTSDRLVDLLVEVARALPTEQLRDLRKRLAA